MCHFHLIYWLKIERVIFILFIGTSKSIEPHSLGSLRSQRAKNICWDHKTCANFIVTEKCISGTLSRNNISLQDALAQEILQKKTLERNNGTRVIKGWNRIEFFKSIVEVEEGVDWGLRSAGGLIRSRKFCVTVQNEPTNSFSPSLLVRLFRWSV